MRAHTPGPWRAVSSRTDGAGGTWGVYGPHRASAFGGIPVLSSGIEEANARLIAAAPVLLEALEEQVAEFDKRMREYIENEDAVIAEIAMKHHGDRMDRARAAIAQARAQ